jgi:prepilin-type N-terminal cleavage/methylation domain-containing protein
MMPNRTSGFTFIEVLMVMIIIGVIAAFGIPRMRDSLQKANVRSARAAAVSQVAKARAAAVQRGCRSTLHLRTTGQVWVTLCGPNGSGLDTIGTVEDVAGRFNVTMTPSADSIRFDPRGLSVDGGTTLIRFTWSNISDSIMINSLGKVVR